jgi:hypothetical protein
MIFDEAITCKILSVLEFINKVGFPMNSSIYLNPKSGFWCEKLSRFSKAYILWLNISKKGENKSAAFSLLTICIYSQVMKCPYFGWHNDPSFYPTIYLNRIYTWRITLFPYQKFLLFLFNYDILLLYLTNSFHIWASPITFRALWNLWHYLHQHFDSNWGLQKSKLAFPKPLHHKSRISERGNSVMTFFRFLSVLVDIFER